MTTECGPAPLLTWSGMSRRNRRLTAAFLAPLALCPFAIALVGSMRLGGFAPRLGWMIFGVPALVVVGFAVVMLPTRRWSANSLPRFRRRALLGSLLWLCLVVAWPPGIAWTAFFGVLALVAGFIASRESFWDLWAADLLRERREEVPDERPLEAEMKAKLLLALAIWWAGVLVFPALVTWRQMSS